MTSSEILYLTPLIENATKKPFASFAKLPSQVQLDHIKSIKRKLTEHRNDLIKKKLPRESVLLRQTEISLKILSQFELEI